MLGRRLSETGGRGGIVVRSCLVLLSFCSLVGSAKAAGVAVASDHPLHLSYGRMVLEGNVIVLNVRLFPDDLERALMQFHGIDALRLRPDPIVDSLFSSYFNARFTLTVADSAIRGVVVESGEGGDMWWYDVLFELESAVKDISFRNDLLFDVFGDQRNITRVLYVPTERHQTFYSVASDPETHHFSVN